MRRKTPLQSPGRKVALSGETGPEQVLASRSGAALQFHQTCHSFAEQHYLKASDRHAGRSQLSQQVQPSRIQVSALGRIVPNANSRRDSSLGKLISPCPPLVQAAADGQRRYRSSRDTGKQRRLSAFRKHKAGYHCIWLRSQALSLPVEADHVTEMPGVVRCVMKGVWFGTACVHHEGCHQGVRHR